jgi:hypothetical protein
MRRRFPGSPRNCAEDRSGSRRSFSLAKAEGVVKSMPKAIRPPPMQARMQGLQRRFKRGMCAG